MLTESEKRAAALAVSRFGADRARVQEAVTSAVRAKENGGSPSLFDILVADNLLTRAQAQELRFSLDATQMDPATAGGNGAQPATPEPTAPPRNGSAQAPAASTA